MTKAEALSSIPDIHIKEQNPSLQVVLCIPHKHAHTINKHDTNIFKNSGLCYVKYIWGEGSKPEIKLLNPNILKQMPKDPKF